jgi:hypothetical protein
MVEPDLKPYQTRAASASTSDSGFKSRRVHFLLRSLRSLSRSWTDRRPTRSLALARETPGVRASETSAGSEDERSESSGRVHVHTESPYSGVSNIFSRREVSLWFVSGVIASLRFVNVTRKNIQMITSIDLYYPELPKPCLYPYDDDKN